MIRERPADAEAIKRTLLGPLIKDRVNDANVKRCAERAVWLGNDETHYERKWQGKDIGDLKKLIVLTVNWVHNSLLTDALVAGMPARK